MPNDLAAPRIAAFPAGPHLWRVEWFGPITFPQREKRFSQPSVQVRLARVRTALEQAFGASAATDASSFSCWISVGALMLVRIGDLWRDRTRVETPDHDVETFKDLQINPSTTQLVKAGAAVDQGNYLIPFRDHPGHQKDTSSNCVCVSLPSNRRLIVPCMELIRFYFGSSSDLLARLFTPPLTKANLFSDANWDLLLQALTVRLAEGIRGSSAVDVARIASNDVAWRAARTVSTSIARACAVGAAGYPTTTFPFEGSTDLVVHGKWLSHADEPKKTFLAYTLRSCSHPFRFQTLRYRVAPGTSTSRTRKKSFAAGDDKAVVGRKAQRAGEGAMEIQEQEASSSLAGRTVHLGDAARFLDLENKRVWSVRSLPMASQTIASVAAKQTSSAVGEANGSEAVRAVSLVTAQEAKPPPEYLLELTDTLRQIPDATLTLLTASDADGWTIRHRFDSIGVACRMAVFLIDRPCAQALVIAIESDALTVLLRPCLPALGQRLLEDAFGDVEAFLGREGCSADLEIDLDDEIASKTLSSGWILDCLEQCVFPAFRE